MRSALDQGTDLRRAPTSGELGGVVVGSGPYPRRRARGLPDRPHSHKHHRGQTISTWRALHRAGHELGPSVGAPGWSQVCGQNRRSSHAELRVRAERATLAAQAEQGKRVYSETPRTIVLAGALGAAEMASIANYCEQLRRGGQVELHLNMSAVTDCHRAGLAGLQALAGGYRTRTRELRHVAVSEQVT